MESCITYPSRPYSNLTAAAARRNSIFSNYLIWFATSRSAMPLRRPCSSICVASIPQLRHGRHSWLLEIRCTDGPNPISVRQYAGPFAVLLATVSHGNYHHCRRAVMKLSASPHFFHANESEFFLAIGPVKRM